MKTKILSMALCLGLIFTSQAQDNSRESSVGLKGGYNLASVTFDGEEETGQRHGFHIGLYGESFISNNFSIQPELQYSQQGYELEGDAGTFTQKLNYINLPIMFKGYLTDGFFIEAGPQIGLAISHKEEFEGTLFDSAAEFDPNNFDYGANFGAGIKTNSGVNIGARYHLGLGDIYEENNPRNRVLQFYVGFDF